MYVLLKRLHQTYEEKNTTPKHRKYFVIIYDSLSSNNNTATCKINETLFSRMSDKMIVKAVIFKATL